MRTAISVLGVFLIVSCSYAKSNEPREIPNISGVQIEKAKRQLHLMSEGKILKTYRISLGSNPVGSKTVEGDGKTPEGIYVIDSRNPDSAFHRSLHVSYPSKNDIQRANSLGKPPGGAIMIHGIKNGLGWIGSLHRISDWTKGCVAVTNDEIEEIWASVKDGTQVEIKP